MLLVKRFDALIQAQLISLYFEYNFEGVEVIVFLSLCLACTLILYYSIWILHLHVQYLLCQSNTVVSLVLLVFFTPVILLYMYLG